MADEFAILERGDGPLLTCALHAGHAMRPELGALCALGDAERLREEDPHTARIAHVGVTTVVAARSRFEVDLNRPREAAVYRTPGEAWGLEVWREPLPSSQIARSLDIHDRFYDAMRELLAATVASHGAAVVFDVHSYNHRRKGQFSPFEDPAGNPEVNIGTGTLHVPRWEGVVSAVTLGLHASGLDVRENVCFRGGHFAAWAHEVFGGDVAVLALEFKKTFMDEWTGEADLAHVERLRSALEGCTPGVADAVAEVVG